MACSRPASSGADVHLAHGEASKKAAQAALRAQSRSSTRRSATGNREVMNHPTAVDHTKNMSQHIVYRLRGDQERTRPPAAGS